MARLYHQELHQVSLGKTSPGFNVDRPWDYVWRQAVLDAEFWREQFVEPAQLVRAHIQSLASTLGGDAPTTRTSHSGSASGSTSAHGSAVDRSKMS
eukprot:1162321-Amphidinium_carterae.1